MLKFNNLDKYKIILLFLFGITWIWSGINPLFPQDWWLENILVLIAFLGVIIGGRYFKLSNISYTLMLIFIILHLIGAHYTYEHVPFGEYLGKILDAQSFEGEGYRNMYDRLVHFSYGFLLYYPFREIYSRIGNMKGFWGIYIPIQSVAAASAIYELMEWGIAVFVAPEAGVAFLGSQGDIWDAQQDMAVATLGALISATITLLIRLKIDKSFFKELKDSFKINTEIMGENLIIKK